MLKLITKDKKYRLEKSILPRPSIASLKNVNINYVSKTKQHDITMQGFR